MINPDHQPYVDSDGWLIPKETMLIQNDKVAVGSDIEQDPRITREYSKALSGKKGIVVTEQHVASHALNGSSVLIKFDEPFPDPYGYRLIVESFWVPRQYVYQCQEEKKDSPFKNYNGPQKPFVGHDGQMHISLDEGDIIERGDYILDDSLGWILAKNCFGDKAPNPCFTSHRQYRRRVCLPNSPVKPIDSVSAEIDGTESLTPAQKGQP